MSTNDTENKNFSRLPGFYELPFKERQLITKKVSHLSDKEFEYLCKLGALNSELSDIFIENAIGAFALPLGLATNFQINGKDYLVPMAVEESSVLAAASHGAKLVRAGGGFKAVATEALMIGQIQLFVEKDAPFDRKLREANGESYY